MSISVLNTDANLSGKTLMALENAETVTALKTFNRGAGNAPFAVTGSVSKVTNLDADLLDGQEGSYYTNAANLASGVAPVARIVAADPGADRLVFWDDSESALAFLTPGSGLTISTTNITAAATQNYLLDKRLDDIAADDTVAETTLYTFDMPANTLGTTRALKLTMFGEISNVSVGSATWTPKITFGGSTVATGTSAGINASVDDIGWRIECYIAPNAATNSQRAHTIWWHGGTDAASATFTSQAVPYQAYTNGLTVDTTAQVTIAFTATMSTATDMTVTMYAALLELIRAD